MSENNYNANGQQPYQAQQTYQQPQQPYQQGYQQNAYQPSGYQAPVYQQPQQTAPVMMIKDWLIMFLISCIPCVGLIMIFVWAFGSGQNPNKSNYAKASLIWALIIAGISVILSLIFSAFIASMWSEIARQIR